MTVRLIEVTQHGDDVIINDTAAPASVIANADAPPTPILANNHSIGPPLGGAVVHHLTDNTNRPVTSATPVSWIVTELSPQFQTPAHATQTHDYGIVLHGDVDLLLETATVTLKTGDAIAIASATHAWRAGKHGATIATVVCPLPAALRPTTSTDTPLRDGGSSGVVGLTR
jgi:quercetin dioxygenase-like cupin family protein